MARIPSPRRRFAPRHAAEVRNYSRKVRWMKVLLPICALVLIVMIFLSGRSREAATGIENAATAAALGAGLRLENPRFAGVTENGEPFVITAASALPDGASPDRVDLEQPNGELRLGDGRTLTVNSGSGEYFRSQERLILREAVTLKTSDGYEVTTDGVDMDLEGRVAVTDGPISASGPAGDLEADAGRLETTADQKTVILHFEGNVRLRLNPAVEQ